MPCVNKVRPQRLHVRKTYHSDKDCQKPVMYLGYFNVTREIDGMSYRPGWQFLPLGWETAHKPGFELRSLRHPKELGRELLMERIHVPE